MELGREATFRLLVLHYFQRGDQAFSTGFPHQRMVRQLSPAALQIGADTIMNISPPLVITEEQVDELVKLARLSLDLTAAKLRE